LACRRRHPRTLPDLRRRPVEQPHPAPRAGGRQPRRCRMDRRRPDGRLTGWTWPCARARCAARHPR